eukprot:TRINITY_DN15649_c0_g1_i1.p1 TRINITY_DN15649_c0_g1~~TRINITY_DN15649_c0_g1_i1.p1  ORF type:complete len:116 (+),score=7.18 TRINITY_DN15649_c0_g1_i1:320-667(+)
MFQSSLESFLETSTAPPGAPDGPTSEQETPLKRPSSPKSYSSFLLRTSLPIPLQQKLSFLRTCKRHACNKWKHVCTTNFPKMRIFIYIIRKYANKQIFSHESCMTYAVLFIAAFL